MNARAATWALLTGALVGCASLPPTGEPFEDVTGWGYRAATGGIAIPAQYALAMPFSRHGIAAVVDDAGWAIIDRRGRVLLRPLLVDNGPDPFSESLARFTLDGKIGFYDRRGAVAIAADFDWAAPFHEGRAAFCRGCRAVAEGEHHRMVGGRWGYLDRRGRAVIAPRFATAASFHGGVASVTLAANTLVIDRHGRPAALPRH